MDDIPEYAQKIVTERGLGWGPSDFRALTEILAVTETEQRHARGDYGPELAALKTACLAEVGGTWLGNLLDGDPYRALNLISDSTYTGDDTEFDRVKALSAELVETLSEMLDVATAIKADAEKLPDPF